MIIVTVAQVAVVSTAIKWIDVSVSSVSYTYGAGGRYARNGVGLLVVIIFWFLLFGGGQGGQTDVHQWTWRRFRR